MQFAAFGFSKPIFTRQYLPTAGQLLSDIDTGITTTPTGGTLPDSANITRDGNLFIFLLFLITRENVK